MKKVIVLFDRPYLRLSKPNPTQPIFTPTYTRVEVSSPPKLNKIIKSIKNIPTHYIKIELTTLPPSPVSTYNIFVD